MEQRNGIKGEEGRKRKVKYAGKEKRGVNLVQGECTDSLPTLLSKSFMP